MTDIWIEYVEKKEKERKKASDNFWKELKEKADKTSCKNCGKKPAYHHKFDGFYNWNMSDFEACLCKECEKRLNEWYFPENP